MADQGTSKAILGHQTHSKGPALSLRSSEARHVSLMKQAKHNHNPTSDAIMAARSPTKDVAGHQPRANETAHGSGGSSKPSHMSLIEKTKHTSATMVAASKDQQAFRFLDLPKELREEVYDYVFRAPVGTTVGKRTFPAGTDLLAAAQYMPGRDVLLVSHAVHDDAVDRLKVAFRTAFFMDNRFRINILEECKSIGRRNALLEAFAKINKLPTCTRVAKVDIIQRRGVSALLGERPKTIRYHEPTNIDSVSIATYFGTEDENWALRQWTREHSLRFCLALKGAAAEQTPGFDKDTVKYMFDLW